MPLDSQAPQLPAGAWSTSPAVSSRDWFTLATTRMFVGAKAPTSEYCQSRAVVAAGSAQRASDIDVAIVR